MLVMSVVFCYVEIVFRTCAIFVIVEANNVMSLSVWYRFCDFLFYFFDGVFAKLEISISVNDTNLLNIQWVVTNFLNIPW